MHKKVLGFVLAAFIVATRVFGYEASPPQPTNTANLLTLDSNSNAIQPAEHECNTQMFESDPTTLASFQDASHKSSLYKVRKSGRPFYAGSFYAGCDHVLVKPHFSRNIAYWSEGEVTSEFSSFAWETNYTPRAYFGYQACNGMGIRGRYWTFDGSASFFKEELSDEEIVIESYLADASVEINVDETLEGLHYIDTRVFDFEFTCHRHFRQGWLTGSGGMRYAKITQGADWYETGNSSAQLNESINLLYEFEGIGPTLALESGVPLFDSSFAFFANYRGSLLFGDRSGSVIGTGAADIIPVYDGLLPMVEGQIGVQWLRAIRGRTLTLRAAMEAQSWFRAGGASGGDDEGMPADQLDLGFFGTSITTIISF